MKKTSNRMMIWLKNGGLGEYIVTSPPMRELHIADTTTAICLKYKVRSITRKMRVSA